jgi:hypothetical protein
MPIIEVSSIRRIWRSLGKRASAVAVLLATSFFGSLLALVLVGRNPQLGPSTDVARTESLVQGVEGRRVTVPRSSPSLSGSTAPDGSDAAFRPAAEVAPSADADRDSGEPPRQDEEGEAVDPAPPPAPEPAPTADDGAVSKVAPESEPATGKATDKAKGKKGNGKGTSEAEGPDDESDGPKGSKGPKGGAKEENGKGSGKGPKDENGKGSGNGAIAPPGPGKGKGGKP